jgi:hypothetical protein
MEIKILGRYRIKPARRVRRRLRPGKASKVAGRSLARQNRRCPWNTELIAARTIREAWGFGLGVLALNLTKSRAVSHEDPPG